MLTICRISAPMPELFDVSAPLASAPSVRYLHLLRPPLRSTPFTKVLTSTPLSPVLDSRSSARTSSDQPWSRLSVFFAIPRSTSPLSTRLSWSVAPPVFLASRSSSPTSLTARSPTSPSTLMRLLPTVLRSRQPSCPVIPRPSLLTRFFCLMLRRSLSVLRLLVV